ncbi:hypothetical protein TPHA_0H02980 [Tetrapisispora phaffii CBS 4417]|uniref:Mto2p-binding domain-containing protein n=1 Tax=Tetrapisispora phaffii (strain ATCC 24235 / CBS 4417 / NBRC 1672 / NRRL Y-8282 / UCD 70-5) TaxID=1071381 RepID=G8BWQ0_TETPH|nr:hypothetical protein TPHA_0H02980 [Tetrapisispora phaffii CBS 4417]CCE64501.1 hypothetical protein TPHA_0H02980 [Tetrapisispora phaffii CBS 4417]
MRMEDFSSDTSYSNNHSSALFSAKVSNSSKTHDSVSDINKRPERSMQGVLGLDMATEKYNGDRKVNNVKSRNRDEDQETDSEDDNELDDDETEDVFASESLANERSSFTVPQLQESLMPWRSSKSDKDKRNSDIQFDLMSPVRYNNIKAAEATNSNRSSLFGINENDLHVTEPTSESSAGIEQLQRDITYYKLKIKTLFELLKQSDKYDHKSSSVDRNSPNSKAKRDSFYNNLLDSISQSNEIEQLKKTIKEQKASLDENESVQANLREKITSVNEMLKLLKQENKETLDYANEYLEHSEQISKNVDELITILIEKLYKISDRRKKTLEKARSISSSFVMVKMNALISSLRRILDDLKYYQKYFEYHNESTKLDDNAEKKQITFIANSTDIQLPSHEAEPIDNQVNSAKYIEQIHSGELDSSRIDTRLENAILDIHSEYADFLHGINIKMQDASLVEESLVSKFSKQMSILNRLASQYQILKQQHDEDLKYQNIKLIGLNNELENKEKLIIELQNENDDRSNIVMKYNKLLKTIDDEKKLFKIKENNLNTLNNELEHDLDENRNANKNLMGIVEQLNHELEHLKLDSSDKFDTMKNNYYNMMQKYNSLNSDYKDLRYENANMIKNYETIQNENYQLKKTLETVETDHNIIIRYESEFNNFKQHLILHLSTIFVTLRKILQPESIDQSEAKVDVIRRLDSLTQMKPMLKRLDSLYTFVETALESIIDSYSILIKETNQIKEDRKYNSAVDTEMHKTELHDQLELRIDELERKWLSERERRKLDNNASEERILKLEEENKLLREKLYNR